ncbi:hypothetical protein HYT84_00530 [Candidatus Micrarchaeota archaeon]|nr:hypothetical protein [Candidatus Micrarchaeota archaeon]
MRPVLYNPLFLWKLAMAHLAGAEIKVFKKDPQIDDYERLMTTRIEFNRSKGRYLSAFYDEQKLVAAYERIGKTDEAYKLRLGSLNTVLDHMLEQARAEKPDIFYLSVLASRLTFKVEGLKLHSDDSAKIGLKIDSLGDLVKAQEPSKKSIDFQILVDSIHLIKWNTTFNY